MVTGGDLWETRSEHPTHSRPTYCRSLLVIEDRAFDLSSDVIIFLGFSTPLEAQSRQRKRCAAGFSETVSVSAARRGLSVDYSALYPSIDESPTPSRW